MNLKPGLFAAAALAVAALGGCGREEEYQNVSEDQLNHYAGIETHDHPVDNGTQVPDRPANGRADKSRQP